MSYQNVLYKEISVKEFNLLKEVIFKESGINLTERKKALMQSRLIKRLRALNLSNFKIYYDYLLNNYNDEIVFLINCITTNKTDFFREPRHFDFLIKTALPELIRTGSIKNGGKLLVWSAGCSTGEEPYTIAMVLTISRIDTRVLNIRSSRRTCL